MQIASGFFCYISSGKQPNNPREVFETVKCFCNRKLLQNNCFYIKSSCIL